ncbi:hypothetical protein DKT77_10350 [Meridianimarinicoccus roseus]|jgi:hypothetical protein|uniref:Uncharacterized protein n=1 Tax=Meridianimarinicoccus roseus TaxID=2072018 RepID=A0A2V2LGF3_9RHOB|nr:hypothetical protein [Meridianimarinicoccus roseus]PWR02584.1 hypothetical protein DKT77_10350 [Meridianimarinicoccus roseus]
MKRELSRALAPVLNRVVPTRAAPQAADPIPADELVRRKTRLLNRDEVARYLPDILGRALARCWIDGAFRDRFLADPKGILAEYDVYLPDIFSIAIETEGASRPRVVVYESNPRNGMRKRLLYLQLVMMAGK